jgi:transposase
MKVQLTRDRVRLQNQMQCLLEEMRIKLSIVVSNLLGASGLRILQALAEGETDAKKLAELGDERLHCTEEQLVDALTGRVQPMHRGMLALQLRRLQLIDQQMAQLNRMIAQPMKSHQDAEVGGQASTFSSAAELTATWEPVLAGKKARSKTIAVAPRKEINTCVEF